jgi:serine/threonine protein kinase
MDLTRHKEVSLSFEQLRCIVQQIVEGLHHVHERGFMHRDVKPSNIYLMEDGTAKVGDFSISRPLKATDAEESEEKTGNITTRHYRAPEIIYGSRHYDQSIDIWGLGCTLAELMLHQTLFPGSSDIHQLELIFNVLGYPVHPSLSSNSTGPRQPICPITWSSTTANLRPAWRTCCPTSLKHCAALSLDV